MASVINRNTPIVSNHQTSAIAAEIDAFGALADQAAPILAKIEELQGRLKPLAAAKKALEAKIEALQVGDDETPVERGAAYVIELGKRSTEREIKDLAQVKKMLGEKVFMSLAKVALKDIDAYLTPPQKEVVLATSRGKRNYKIAKRVD